jgi:hypothetical protein
MLSEKEMYQYLGLGAVVIFVTYIVLRTLNFQARVIEGAVGSMGGTDTEKIPDAVRANTNTIEDSLLVTKYRKVHEDTILNLEANASAAILATSLNNAELISKDPTSEGAQKLIVKINSLKAFRDSLNDAMAHLDKV